MTSGFLCFRKCNLIEVADAESPSSKRIRNTIRRIGLLYLKWSAIFLPITVYGIVINCIGGSSLAHQLGRVVLRYFLAGDQFLSQPLWYLLASFVAFAVVYVLLRKGLSWRRILAFSCMLMLFGFCCQLLVGWGVDGHLGAVGRLVQHYQYLFGRNGFIPGFFYVALGGFVATVDRERPWQPLLFGLIVGLALMFFVSGPLLNPTGRWTFGLICSPFCALSAYCCFALCISLPGHEAHPFARYASTVIYLVHMWFVFVLYLLVFGVASDSILNLSSVAPQPLSFAFVLTGALAVAFVAWPLRKTRVVRFLFG